MIRLVYRALTGMNGETRFAMVAIAAPIKRRTRAKSKPQCHPDMARLKSQPLVESLRIDAGMMREQLDQPAAGAARLGDGPGER